MISYGCFIFKHSTISTVESVGHPRISAVLIAFFLANPGAEYAHGQNAVPD